MKLKVKNIILNLIILSFLSTSVKAENESVINNIKIDIEKDLKVEL